MYEKISISQICTLSIHGKESIDCEILPQWEKETEY